MPGYKVKHESMMLGDSAFTIRSLFDNQQYADADGAAAAAGISASSWSLFGLVWPSARILAAEMQTHDIAGKRILEIGCGLALASLVLHRRKGDITASDRHPLAQSFLDKNLFLNDMPALPYQIGNWERDNPALGRFDLIIASDVLYERDQPRDLAAFIAAHACAKVEVVIVDPDRGNRSAFCQQMAAQGFKGDVRQAAPARGNVDPFKAHLVTCTRRCS